MIGSAVLALATITPVALAVMGVDAPTAQAEPAPPDVIIVLTDDQRADELQYMPNVQSLLADQGTTFSRYYYNISVCCPSRATMLSGRYGHNTGVTDNSSGAAFDDSNSLATMLGAAGYRTSYIGKYLNGYGCTKPQPQGWTDWQALCHRVQSKKNYRINDNGTVVQYGALPADYQTDVLANRARTTIAEMTASSDPYFMVVAPTAPHGPNHVAARHKTAFADFELPLSPSYAEADVSDKPAWIQALPLPKTISIEKSERKRLQMLLAVDEMVGGIVADLQASGRLDNTIIMFASDNGFMRGEHRIKQGKDHFYEESLRGPLVARGPGIPVGAVNDTLISNADLAPFVVARAGATPTIDFDGQDFGPALSDPDALENRVLLHFRPAWDRAPRVPQAFGLTTDDGLKYSRFAGGVEELYDLLVDPYELTNVATSPDYAAVRSELAALLTSLQTCEAASCHATYNRAPTASFTATPAGPGAVHVDGSASSDPGGSIQSWDWDFGDGSTGTGALADHTYAADGTYTITLTVTDDDGRSASTTRTVTVDADEPPTAAFTATPTALDVAFDGTTSTDPDGTVVDWAWDFGDGATGTGPTPTHTYAAGGTYTVTLTVTDDDGHTDSVQADVTVVADEPPTAAFTATPTALDVAFDGTTSTDPDGTVVDWAWDFGDGATGTGPTPTHTYAASGTYTVTLTVTDDDGHTDSVQADVTVTA